MSETEKAEKEYKVAAEPAVVEEHKTSPDVAGYNVLQILFSGLLLFGPFLMGVAINSLGNENPIRAHFARFGGYTNRTDDPQAFPSDLWSLGFLYPFGGLFGSLIGAGTVDKYGRRKPTIFFALLMIVGGILKIVSRYSHVALLFISRFCDGIATSGFMVSAVLLLLESLPAKVEKIYKPLVQMSINAGILFLGIISLNDVAKDNWNLIHINAIVISVILIVVVIFHPESPKFVYSSRRNTNATREVFRALRGKYYNESEVEKLKKDVESTKDMKKMSIMEFLKEKKFRFPIVSLIFLHIGQQLCGINAIMAFAPSLLNQAGFKEGDTGGTIIFAVGTIGSIIFAPIIGNQKRKILWLTGFLFQTIAFCSLLICSYAKAPSGLQIFWLCLFVFIFQIGPGPVVWFISLEMFPPQAIGAAQGVASFFNWFANTLVYLIFPIAVTRIGIQVLFIFVAFEIAIVVYSVFFVLETFNKSYTQVLDEYAKLLNPNYVPTDSSLEQYKVEKPSA